MKFRFGFKNRNVDFRSKEAVACFNEGGKEPRIEKSTQRGLVDIGNEPAVMNVKTMAYLNDAHMRTIWTGEKMQLTLMSIPDGEVQPPEIHNSSEQMLMVIDGVLEVEMGKTPECDNIRVKAEEGYAVLVPLGMYHRLRNGGKGALKILSVYAPRKHRHSSFEW